MLSSLAALKPVSAQQFMLYWGSDQGARNQRQRVKRAKAIGLLKQREAELRNLGVTRLYLFGSTARDEARIDSDVDLFFDHPRGELSLYGLMDIKDLVRRILGRPTDIMTRSSLHPALRDRIEASALRVF